MKDIVKEVLNEKDNTTERTNCVFSKKNKYEPVVPSVNCIPMPSIGNAIPSINKEDNKSEDK